MSLTVVIAGGGTGGHVFPGLTLAAELGRRGHRVSWAGRAGGAEARLVAQAGLEFHPVESEQLVGEGALRSARAAWTALSSVGGARSAVRGADVVVGMGGYVSAPVVLAARLLRVPVVIDEQNSIPGLANRSLSHLARAVALGFPTARWRLPRRVRAVVTGNPVREAIRRVPAERAVLLPEARREFGLRAGRRTVAIFGGSQGALHLGQASAGACRVLAGRGDLQILLVTGPAHLESVRRMLPAEAGELLVRTTGFVERMELLYAAADLIVARSGAGSVSEISACGLPAILVPYPHAVAGEQEANAGALRRAGGAVVMPDSSLSPSALAGRIVELVDDRERLGEMGRRSAAFGRPGATEALADLVEEVAA